MVAVYPRGCGGTDRRQVLYDQGEGLSPRVWGHPEIDNVVCARLRSIPTCVGASSIDSAACAKPEVYPHVCGGIAGDPEYLTEHTGLSPRVWGHPR